MSLIKQRNSSDYLFILLGCLITVYLLLRTYFVDITDDEAWSFYNVKKFWYVEALCSGNTHWFNFAAIKVALLLGLEQVWQIRWLSVLSGIMFLYLGYKWVKTLDGLALKLFAFSFLFLNPYLLEYLTLARGYSSALCFMVFSLIFLFKSLKENEKRSFAFYSLVFAGCSAIANFGFFYFFLSFGAIYFYRFHFKNGIAFIKTKSFYVDLFYAIGISALVLRALLFIKECSNDIGSFGGGDLTSSVFCNFIETLIYNNFHLSNIIRDTLGIGLFAFIFTAALFGIIRYKKHKDNLYFYSSLILLILLALTVFNKWVFNILYPTERTALMFYPLMTIILVGFLKNMIVTKAFYQKIILYLISLILIINFCFSLNLKTGYDHPFCKDSKSYFDYLNTLNPKKIGMPLELYCVFVKYYQITGCEFEGESINTVGYDHPYIKKNRLEDFEYLLLFYPYNLSYYKGTPIKLTKIKLFPDSKTMVVKVEK